MNRKSWASVMIVALLVAAGAGTFLWSRLNAPAAVAVPLEQVATPTPTSAPISVAGASATVRTDVAHDASVPAATAPEDASAVEMRNISFNLFSQNAHEVFIVGDFNKWLRKPLTKKGKTWQISIALKPGTYQYMFIVDGKRVRDPNNKSVSEDGQSVLTVKPLALKS